VSGNAFDPVPPLDTGGLGTVGVIVVSGDSLDPVPPPDTGGLWKVGGVVGTFGAKTLFRLPPDVVSLPTTGSSGEPVTGDGSSSRSCLPPRAASVDLLRPPPIPTTPETEPRRAKRSTMGFMYSLLEVLFHQSDLNKVDTERGRT
jgi:hypothetical protein